MRLFACGLATLALSVSASVLAETPPAGSWAFEPKPDPFTADALLDLQSLNEAASGETGFVRLSEDGNDFVRGDGEPIRFWAIGSDVYHRSPEEMDLHCRFLAKRGVNMVRLHATIAATEEGSKITDVNEKEIEGIFRFVKAAKANGIYLTISPFYGHFDTPKNWGLDGYAGKKPWGAIFVDPQMQEAYKVWTRALYTRVNPHTGLAIKDDPTVALLQVHNEDSMFFWTFQELPEPQAKRLGNVFGDWLAMKYGSVEKAVAAWDGQRDAKDDVAAGVVGILGSWHLTQDHAGGLAKRVRDQTEFMARHQREFYAGMGRYLREELGCKQLLNATNWRTADDARLKDIERWTYAALDVSAENEYYGSDYQHVGENNGYRIDPGHHLVNESVLHKPLELPVNYKMQRGHPFVVTETSWKHPNLYQAEGPFLVAAYQSLNGLDAVFWFSADEPAWNLDPRWTFWQVDGKNPLKKWTASTPMLVGMFPANALLYRKGYVRQAPVVVRETQSLDDLWDRKPAAIEDNEIYGVSRETEELKSVRRPDGRVSRAAYLVGRVETDYGDRTGVKVEDFSKRLDAERGTVGAAQAGPEGRPGLSWNYREGFCVMSYPKAQGVAGFLKDNELAVSDDLTIRGGDGYAAVSVVAMDDRPLRESRKVLVQVGTTARLTGWKTEPAEFEFGDTKTKIKGERIIDTGKPPWRIANTDVTLDLRNPHLTKATKLDPNGYAAGDVPVGRVGETLGVTLPEDAMYLMLQ